MHKLDFHPHSQPGLDAEMALNIRLVYQYSSSHQYSDLLHHSLDLPMRRMVNVQFNQKKFNLTDSNKCHCVICSAHIHHMYLWNMFLLIPQSSLLNIRRMTNDLLIVLILKQTFWNASQFRIRWGDHLLGSNGSSVNKKNDKMNLSCGHILTTHSSFINTSLRVWEKAHGVAFVCAHIIWMPGPRRLPVSGLCLKAHVAEGVCTYLRHASRC